MPKKSKRKVSSRKKKTSTKRRRTTSKTMTRKKSSNGIRKGDVVAEQLRVYANPHSMVTSQPKIPDGRVQRSLGLSSQGAGELTAYTGDIPAGQNGSTTGDGVLHILMYAGQNSGAIILNSLNACRDSAGTVYLNDEAVGEFMRWNGAPETSISAILNDTSGGTLNYSDEYSRWRVVSQGLTLGLLNPAEEDDGWYEMVRVYDTLDTNDYCIMNADRSPINARGTVCPKYKLANDLMSRSLANNVSYKTGLLRNIHKEYFQLLPNYTDHEFKQQMDTYNLSGDDVAAVSISGSGTGRFVQFNAGREPVRELINSKIDEAFDMIYIRIHGRTNPASPTRIHYNICANHEVTYSNDQVEHRFMTPSYNHKSRVEAVKEKMMKTEAHADQKHRNPGEL